MEELSNSDVELLRVLASMSNETVIISDKNIKIVSECPTFGGAYFASTQAGLEDAIELYTGSLLSQLD